MFRASGLWYLGGRTLFELGVASICLFQHNNDVAANSSAMPCGSLFEPDSLIRVTSVVFGYCDPSRQQDELHLRQKIAEWIVQECGHALSCHVGSTLTADNVLLLTALCTNDTESGFQIVVLRLTKSVFIIFYLIFIIICIQQCLTVIRRLVFF